jgi:hypothetical protein
MHFSVTKKNWPETNEAYLSSFFLIVNIIKISGCHTEDNDYICIVIHRDNDLNDYNIQKMEFFINFQLHISKLTNISLRNLF